MSEQKALSGVGGWLRTDGLGHLQIPVETLKAAGIDADEPVHVSVSEGGVEILTRRRALNRAHEIARQFVPEGTSVVDELIAERRREAALEDDDA
jgi:hypothetical protein